MKRTSTILMIFAVVVVAVFATLFFLQRPDFLTEATQPQPVDAQAGAAACAGLSGQELEQCRTRTWFQAEPRQYEKGPDGPEIDASANAARGARGSGVEGVTSGGTTTTTRER